MAFIWSNFACICWSWASFEFIFWSAAQTRHFRRPATTWTALVKLRNKRIMPAYSFILQIFIEHSRNNWTILQRRLTACCALLSQMTPFMGVFFCSQKQSLTKWQMVPGRISANLENLCLIDQLNKFEKKKSALLLRVAWWHQRIYRKFFDQDSLYTRHICGFSTSELKNGLAYFSNVVLTGLTSGRYLLSITQNASTSHP